MTTETQLPDDSFLGKLARITMIVACVSLVGVAVVEGWQVFARYVMGESPSWTEPVTLLFMGTAMMGGAAVGVRGNRHFGFFMLADLARPNIKRVLVLLPIVIAIGVGGIFLFAGGHLVSESWDFPMAGAPLPQGVVYLPISIGGALIAIFAIERLIATRASKADATPTPDKNN